MNTKKLIKQAKRGNKDAIVTLIMAQQHDYYRLAYSYVDNEHDAMDALENMIVVIYHKIKQLRNEDAFYSWSKTILVNECRAILKMIKFQTNPLYSRNHHSHKKIATRLVPPCRSIYKVILIPRSITPSFSLLESVLLYRSD